MSKAIERTRVVQEEVDEVFGKVVEAME
ncbi:hypothetical protein C5S35_17860 [Candidatus Methanophagaceae archaeon]|nr:hypothetical protein C5S35_17860 [Methanophagales archaeon]